MSTLKKILSLSLALAMLMSVSVFAGFADAAEIDKDAAAAVELLAAVKILNGFPKEDGTYDFKPAETIQRDQAAKMIYVLRNGGVDDGAETWKAAVSFADVAKDNWAAGYIAYCETYGIINGRTETVFDPTAPLTGVELAKLLLTVAGYKGDVEGYTGTGWEKNVVADANEAGLFAGVKDALSQPITRQYAAVMFENAFAVKVPTYIGDYRVDGILGNEEKAQTVAGKFLDYKQSTDYVVANDVWATEGTKAAAGKTKLATAGEVAFDVADALVGQQVTVTKVGTTVLSIVATGKSNIGELTVGAAIAAGQTDAGKYPVKVNGKVMANLAGTDAITVTIVNAGVAASKYAAVDTVKELKDAMEGKTTSVKVIGVDKDGDKVLEKIILVEDQYVAISGTVTTGTTKGQFTIGALTVDKDGKIGGVAADIKVTAQDGLVVKASKDYMTGKITVAGADIAGGKLTGISGNKYTIGTATYEISDNAIETTILGLSGMNKDLVVFTDGKYIISATEATTGTTTPSTPADPTALPEQLAYIIDGAKVKVGEKDVTDSWGAVTGKTDVFAYKLLVLLKGESKEQQVVYYEATGSSDKTLEKSYTVADLFDGTSLKTEFKGGVFEYVKNGDKIHLKKDLGKVTGYKFFAAEDTAPVDKLANVTGAMGDTATYNKNSKLFEGLAANVFVIGSDDATIFAHYQYTKDGAVKHEYKFIKVADLADYNYTLKVLAATNETIGKVAIATAELTPKTADPVTEVPAYILATSGAELAVEGTKIYAKFNAVDLKTGVAGTFKLEAKTETVAMYEKVKAGQIFEIKTANGVVTQISDAQTTATWTRGSVTAEVADLLLINGAIVETKGDNKGFATDCKVIVKNGTTYTLGTIDNIGVAAKDSNGNFYNNLLFVKANDKFAYVIVDLDGNLEITVAADTNVITVK